MTASMEASSDNQDQGRASHDHAFRLHKRYLALEFKSDPNDPQDLRREGLFKRLVLHHLLEHLIYTPVDWEAELKKSIFGSNTNKDKCTYNFLRAYSGLLWPSFMVERHHLQVARIRGLPWKQRSWIGGYDGAHSFPDSTLGVLVKAYVEVLLEGGLVGAVVEDPGALIAGIRSVEVGPEILAPVVAVKGEGASKGGVAVEVEVEVGDVEDVIMSGC